MTVKDRNQLETEWTATGADRAMGVSEHLECFDCLQAGCGLWLPHTGPTTPYEQAIVGSSWQRLDCWTNAHPASGGRGMLPNLSTYRMTVETGGAGDWFFGWSTYFNSDDDVEIGLRLNGSGVGLISGAAPGNRRHPGVTFLAPVTLSTADYIEMVARAENGQTANLDIFTAHLFARRVLPS